MKRNYHTKRKRQHQGQWYPEETQHSYEEQQQERRRAMAVLHIQAHEADIVHGAAIRAKSLEVDANGRPGPRTALIKVDRPAGGSGIPSQWSVEDDTFTLRSVTRTPDLKGQDRAGGSSEVWVDRFDLRLLMDTLEDVAGDPEPSSPASSTWSDFPEDSPGTFFLSPSEIEDYHVAKRRRMLNEAHERRLREREEEDQVAETEETSEETEPSPEALTLIERTAKHLLSASNPAQLEMRILANHGADERFSFLRDGGKWHQIWLDTKSRLQEEMRREKEVSEKPMGLGGLAAYGSDSDSDGDGDAGSEHGEVVEPSEPGAPPPPLPDPEPPKPEDEPTADSDALKEQRRARAREWMLSRKKEDVQK